MIPKKKKKLERTVKEPEVKRKGEQTGTRLRERTGEKGVSPEAIKEKKFKKIKEFIGGVQEKFKKGFKADVKAKGFLPGGVTPMEALTGKSHKERMTDVYKVMKVILNPFSKEKVVATTDNRIFNTAVEYVANAPYTSALMLTGVGGVLKGVAGKIAAPAAKGIGKFATGKLVQTTLTGGPAFAVNTRTAAASGMMIAKILAQMKKPVFILSAIGASIGTYPWAEWATTEAMEIMGFSTKNAINSEDPELIRETMRVYDEIYNPEVWEHIGRLIPLANIAVGFRKKFKALIAQKAVNDKIMQDVITQLLEGLNDEEKWKRVRQEAADQRDAVIDFYNSERKKMLSWEADAAKKNLKKEAAFWAAEAAKQKGLEEKERIAVTEFWLAYRKTILKYIAHDRPSNLNFGLFVV